MAKPVHGIGTLLAQLTLPFTESAGPAHRTVTLGGRVYDIVIARHRRARRYVLRLAEPWRLRLTVPRGASIAGGLRFAERQAGWVDREERRRREGAEPWRDGTRIWFRGEFVALGVAGRQVRLGAGQIEVLVGNLDVRPAVEAHMTALAAAELPPRGRELAARHELAIAGIQVRNQRSRWGACSPRRFITLNWRLIQMPPQVSDYVMLHELMHLRQPNHSRRFWREVDRVCPEWRDAERWLRRHGREIL